MVVIIDYGLGNLGSIFNMLRKIGAEAKVSADLDDIFQADKLILPGVGSFDQGVENLKQRNLWNPLNEVVLRGNKSILGICLGMQLLGQRSEEGKEDGLGWLDFTSKRFCFAKNMEQKIPHVGWNYVHFSKPENPLLQGLTDYMRFYFVHSYHAVCQQSEDIILTCNYGYLFPAGVAHGNIYGVQFHPEKSHRFGMQILKNFVEWC